MSRYHHERGVPMTNGCSVDGTESACRSRVYPGGHPENVVVPHPGTRKWTSARNIEPGRRTQSHPEGGPQLKPPPLPGGTYCPDRVVRKIILGRASRLATLFLGHSCPICSLVAPGQPGAAPGAYHANHAVRTRPATGSPPSARPRAERPASGPSRARQSDTENRRRSPRVRPAGTAMPPMPGVSDTPPPRPVPSSART